MDPSTSFLKHNDLGRRGSEFIYMHQPVKNEWTIFFVAIISVLMSISFCLHNLNMNVLALITLGLIMTLGIWLCSKSKVYSETFLILPSIGVQVQTMYVFGNTTTHFIDASHIHDIVINEAVSMHCITTYLVVLLKESHINNKKELYQVFAHSWPPLTDLIQVYRAAQLKLIHPKDL